MNLEDYLRKWLIKNRTNCFICKLKLTFFTYRTIWIIKKLSISFKQENSKGKSNNKTICREKADIAIPTVYMCKNSDKRQSDKIIFVTFYRTPRVVVFETHFWAWEILFTCTQMSKKNENDDATYRKKRWHSIVKLRPHKLKIISMQYLFLIYFIKVRKVAKTMKMSNIISKSWYFLMNLTTILMTYKMSSSI